MQPCTVRSWVYMEIVFCIVKGVSIESIGTMRKFGLQADLEKAARHLVLEQRPFGRYVERPNISTLGSHGGSDMFDITIFHTLSGSNSRWIGEPFDYTEECMGPKNKKIPKSPSRLCHPHAHRAKGTIAVNIASRTLSSLQYACATLFQRHTALFVANNSVCPMSGFDFEL